MSITVHQGAVMSLDRWFKGSRREGGLANTDVQERYRTLCLLWCFCFLIDLCCLAIFHLAFGLSVSKASVIPEGLRLPRAPNAQLNLKFSMAITSMRLLLPYLYPLVISREQRPSKRRRGSRECVKVKRQFTATK